MLKLDRVSKVYRVGTFGGKELRAVRDVSFDVRDGEVVSLIGESGSGKTTIGKMILRLLSVASGTISIDGVDISTFKGEALKEFYRKVQGVFQDPFSSFNPIFKADRMFQMLKEEFYPDMESDEWGKKVDDSLKCVGLNTEHVLHKFPHQLSGGQLQRFLISRACLLEINLLVADEIISMLDASTRIDVLNLLADLKSGGLSILFITHDLSLAYYISERAVILQKGRVVEMGLSEKVFQNPLHPYTRMLMASVPRLDRRWEGAEHDLGQVAQPSDIAGGPADADTPGHEPELVEAEPDHFVAVAG